MLNRIVAITILVALLSSNFYRFFVFANFQLNKKYIATTLCENRDKPWLHCNGHCYFMKKIKEAQDKEKSNDRENQKNLFQEVYCSGPADIAFHSHLLRTINTPYKTTIVNTFKAPLFRPPQA